MDLKDNLLNQLVKQIVKLEISLKNLEGSLSHLNKTDINDADYIVNLISLWENEGEKSVIKVYRGKLEDAIKSAESEYLQLNNRNDIQASYHVALVLDEIKIGISEEFYRDYIRK
ncbi:MAG: hypothetical protein WC867_05955 [Candidatus Pacearchaeota archaeon]|jgi:hypothetical protein